MTLELPPSGSIWRYRVGAGHCQVRVIYSSEDDIIAHNAECADIAGRILTWRGDAAFFHQCFAPGDPETYPRTACIP